MIGNEEQKEQKSNKCECHIIMSEMNDWLKFSYGYFYQCNACK